MAMRPARPAPCLQRIVSGEDLSSQAERQTSGSCSAACLPVREDPDSFAVRVSEVDVDVLDSPGVPIGARHRGRMTFDASGTSFRMRALKPGRSTASLDLSHSASAPLIAASAAEAAQLLRPTSPSITSTLTSYFWPTRPTEPPATASAPAAALKGPSTSAPVHGTPSLSPSPPPSPPLSTLSLHLKHMQELNQSARTPPPAAQSSFASYLWLSAAPEKAPEPSEKPQNGLAKAASSALSKSVLSSAFENSSLPTALSGPAALSVSSSKASSTVSIGCTGGGKTGDDPRSRLATEGPSSHHITDTGTDNAATADPESAPANSAGLAAPSTVAALNSTTRLPAPSAPNANVASEAPPRDSPLGSSSCTAPSSTKSGSAGGVATPRKGSSSGAAHMPNTSTPAPLVEIASDHGTSRGCALDAVDTPGTTPAIRGHIPDHFLIQLGAVLDEQPCIQHLERSGLPPPINHADSLLGVPTDPSNAASQSWEPMLSEHDASRRVTYRADKRLLRNGVYAYRTTTLFERCSAAHLRRFNLDDDLNQTWNFNTLECRRLGEGPPSSDASTSDASPKPESGLLYMRCRFPGLFCDREYVFARRVWHRPGDGGCYAISLARPIDGTDNLCKHRTFRVVDYVSAFVVRDVETENGPAVECKAVYFESSGVPPLFSNMAVQKGLWGAVQGHAKHFHAFVDAIGSTDGATQGSAAYLQAHRDEQQNRQRWVVATAKKVAAAAKPLAPLGWMLGGMCLTVMHGSVTRRGLRR